jgi:clan AA aspartic protease
MGLAYAQLTLENLRDSALRPMQVRALADTGSVYLCLPPHVATQLKLEEITRKEVFTADGSSHSCAYVGPVRVRCDNRDCFVGAIVLGDEVLLGAIPMEDMDLVILAQEQRVVANPRNPNFAAALAKGVRARQSA